LNGSNVEALLQAWMNAKQAEDEAEAERLGIEDQIALAFERKSEGAVTHTVGEYKVTLTQPVYRKIDENTWRQVASLCPELLRPVKTKIEADAAGVKYLQHNEPEIWSKIARAFETKPGKLGVKVTKNGD
jgi:hypothetical protein